MLTLINLRMGHKLLKKFSLAAAINGTRISRSHAIADMITNG